MDWTVSRSHDAFAFLVAIYPWLCERRQRQAVEACTRWLNQVDGTQAARERTHCKSGNHRWIPENVTHREGRKICRLCANDLARRYRLEKRQASTDHSLD